MAPLQEQKRLQQLAPEPAAPWRKLTRTDPVLATALVLRVLLATLAVALVLGTIFLGVLALVLFRLR